jgi:peptidoglycan/LPS O-acetylase OafA/YrhL
MRRIVPLLGLLGFAAAAACSAAPGQRVVGWKVDPNYKPPAHSYLLIHGPADQIAKVIQESRAFGWLPVEHAALASGSAFALMAGPTGLRSNERMWDLILPRPITVGPAMTPSERSIGR